MVEEENSHYLVSPIDNQRFFFIGSSFSESVDVVYKDEEENWCLAAPEEQNYRILAPSEKSSCIC